jgi:FAD synthetase
MYRKEKKVMVFGTFDVLHLGHQKFFEQAKSYGDFLIVVVARDKNVCKIKGRRPKNNEQRRLRNILKLKIVDQAVLGFVKNRFQIIAQYRPDIICLGYDQPIKKKTLLKELKKFGLQPKIYRLKSFMPWKYKSSKILGTYKSIRLNGVHKF